jgi:ribosome-binding factor A
MCALWLNLTRESFRGAWSAVVMGNRKNRGQVPPFVNNEFAEALSGKSESSWRRKNNYKDLQLCRQVQRAITLALPAGDDLLGALYVSEVTPAPDAAHLLVHVVIPAGVPIAEALQKLSEVAPRLRADVARAITRKRAPELSFIPSRAGEVTP